MDANLAIKKKNSYRPDLCGFSIVKGQKYSGTPNSVGEWEDNIW